MNSQRNRRTIILGFLVGHTAAVWAVNVTEPPDFSASSNVSVGTLDSGVNMVSGGLSGACNIGDCNPNSSADTQDSFTLTVPAGYQITSLTVTTSAVSGPTNFSASVELDFVAGGIVHSTPSLSPLNGTTANLLTAPVGTGAYRLSVYGQGATAAGAFSLNWLVTMNLAPAVSTQTSLANPNFAGSLNGWRLNINSLGPGLVSFDSTRNASGSQSGSLKSINNVDQSSNPYCNNSLPCVTIFPAEQCLPVTPGKTYAFGSEVFIPRGQSSSGQGGIGVSFWANTTCNGNWVGSSSGPSVTSVGEWTLSSGKGLAPPGSVSARVLLNNGRIGRTGAFQVNHDDVFFREATAADCAVVDPGHQVPVKTTGFSHSFKTADEVLGFVGTNVGATPVQTPFVLIEEYRTANGTPVTMLGPITRCLSANPLHYVPLADILLPGRKAANVAEFDILGNGFYGGLRVHGATTH